MKMEILLIAFIILYVKAQKTCKESGIHKSGPKTGAYSYRFCNALSYDTHPSQYEPQTVRCCHVKAKNGDSHIHGCMEIKSYEFDHIKDFKKNYPPEGGFYSDYDIGEYKITDIDCSSKYISTFLMISLIFLL